MTDADPHAAPEEEWDRVEGRQAAGVVVAGLAIGGVCVLIAAVLLRAEEHAFGAPAMHRARSAGPAASPRVGIERTLIEDASPGWRERAAQLRELRNYRWVDRSRGVAAIPIDRAMDLVVKEGAR